ncbi:MAG: GDP-mannose 4,6-dehydratase, partial [Deltaproteobacteria bacterium]|nr:GDP-mannose 4,6-dehydratase [Deltaproteobacteria bacterium]
VVATGETHSVREFLEEAFKLVKLNYQDHVKLDPRYLRPTEVDLLIGDCSKAKRELKWEHTITFRELVQLMVREDLKLEGLDPERYIRK